MNSRLARPITIAGVVVVALLAVALLAAGRTGGTETSSSRSASAPEPTAISTAPTPPTPITPLTPAAEPAAVTEPSPRPATDLEDGQHAARIEDIDVDRRQITVDVVQFLMGEDAARAAAEDGADEVPPPNDYYIRNANPRLRTLSVARDAPITINTLGAAESGNSAQDIAKSLDQLAAIDSLERGVFWLTVSGGTVTRIAEQYTP
jgi:hypothetical protein